MTEFEWDPDTYLALMRDEIPGYFELQEHVAEATRGLQVDSVLELGTGTGETAERVLALHPQAHWTGVDASESMLAAARRRLPDADLRVARLEDPLPQGPFDLVVSALAVHHLDGRGKRDLFRRVAAVLRPGGAFVLGDVVVPEHALEARIHIDWVLDLPDRAEDQLAWLAQAGFAAEPRWADHDLAVLRAKRQS